MILSSSRAFGLRRNDCIHTLFWWDSCDIMFTSVLNRKTAFTLIAKKLVLIRHLPVLIKSMSQSVLYRKGIFFFSWPHWSWLPSPPDMTACSQIWDRWQCWGVGLASDWCTKQEGGKARPVDYRLYRSFLNYWAKSKRTQMLPTLHCSIGYAPGW